MTAIGIPETYFEDYHLSLTQKSGKSAIRGWARTMKMMKLERSDPMPLVKIKQRYQVTIPASIRGKVPLGVGDILDVTLCKDGILLKPQTILERKEVAGKLRKAFAAINEKNPYARMSDEEIMEAAIGIVGQARTDRKAGKTPEKA